MGEDEEVVEEAVEDDCTGEGDDDVESPKVALSILSSSQSSADLIKVEIITPPLSAVACGVRGSVMRRATAAAAVWPSIPGR